VAGLNIKVASSVHEFFGKGGGEFDRKKTPPEGGFSFLACFCFKRRAEEDPRKI